MPSKGPWMRRADCAFIIGWRRQSPAFQIPISNIDYLQIFTEEPEYHTITKIKIFTKNGAEIEIDDAEACADFGKQHKAAFEEQGGHYHYICPPITPPH